MKDNTVDIPAFVLVQWPQSQELMECDWFNDEASSADTNKYGNLAYFVPRNRYETFVLEAEKKFKAAQTGACIAWDGTYCKAEDFVSRMNYARSKYHPSADEISAIKKQYATAYETIKDRDDPTKFEWYQIGEEKYGRSMYCPLTKIRRTQTMGEFYGNSTVD